MIKRLRKEKGFSLIEVIIALGLLGIVGIAFMSALATASTSIIVNDERTTAESLARSEIEFVKSQDYIDYSEDSHDVYDTTIAPTNYSIATTIVPFDANTGTPYSEFGGVFEQDDGIQMISVTITFLPEDKTILTLENYKTKAK